jgi:hypothetical protein
MNALTFIPRARALQCLNNWPDLAKRPFLSGKGQGNGPLELLRTLYFDFQRST